MTNLSAVLDIDQQIAQMEAAAAELRAAKANAQAAADASLRNSAIYQKQQQFLDAESARRAGIVASFVAGPLTAAQGAAQEAAQGPEADLAAILEEIRKLAERLRQLQEQAGAIQGDAFNKRNTILVELLKAFTAHEWADYWQNINPADPDGAAVAAFKAWAEGLFTKDLHTQLLITDKRSTHQMVKEFVRTVAMQIRNLRGGLQWADATNAATNAARLRQIAMRQLGL